MNLSSPLVEVRKVTKKYRNVTALQEITLNIRRGEWITLMGPSGSGKTTLLNLLSGLDQPTSGEVMVKGQIIHTLPSPQLIRFRRETIGFIFQQYHLIPYLTVLENVMVAQYLHSLVDRKEAIHALEEVGLDHRLQHLPSQLSGGEQQRVCLARALINQPELILADEPTGNLDEENEKKVMEILSRLHQKGHTLILVTHDIAIARFSERILTLKHGVLLGESRLLTQDEELFDEVLQQIWENTEQEGEVCADMNDLLVNQNLIRRMAQEGFLIQRADTLELTTKGLSRAKDVVRRHRLAERLFSDTLNMAQNENIEANACVFEHILSPEVTEGICRLLNHPSTCPHKRPIPKGPCCEPSASGGPAGKG